ncbi:hypothetical protein KEM48_010424 [Puccinia striiformis f. sp. tritici PST-130]|nr:hypothetical protein KEM48_010424 [Puccinia striiformis f. sp. tritici PST-130]
MKDPMNLHRSIHSKVVALKRSDENFVAWERQINETLDFVFHTDDFITNSSWDLLHTEHFPSVTILLRSSVELPMRNMLAKVKGPKAIFNTICVTCKRGDLCQEITQVKGELNTGTSNNPILINRLQTNDRSQKGKRNEKPPRPTFGAKALANALQFKGVQPTAKDFAENGNVCSYCEKKFHWASNCLKFDADLRNGKIKLGNMATAALPSGPHNQVPDHVRWYDTDSQPLPQPVHTLCHPVAWDAHYVRTATSIR